MTAPPDTVLGQAHRPPRVRTDHWEDHLLIVSGKLYVDPEARDDYLAGSVEVIEQARLAPGCVDFALSADLLEPGRINVYECWETDTHLANFRGSGPSADQTAEIRDASVMKHRISSTEPP